MNRLTPEREAEIRRCPVDWYGYNRDLLAEIDALRDREKLIFATIDENFDRWCRRAEESDDMRELFLGRADGLSQLRSDITKALREPLSSSHH